MSTDDYSCEHGYGDHGYGCSECENARDQKNELEDALERAEKAEARIKELESEIINLKCDLSDALTPPDVDWSPMSPPMSPPCTYCDQISGHEPPCVWITEEIATVNEKAAKLEAEFGSAEEGSEARLPVLYDAPAAEPCPYKRGDAVITPDGTTRVVNSIDVRVHVEIGATCSHHRPRDLKPAGKPQ